VTGKTRRHAYGGKDLRLSGLSVGYCNSCVFLLMLYINNNNIKKKKCFLK